MQIPAVVIAGVVVTAAAAGVGIALASGHGTASGARTLAASACTEYHNPDGVDQQTIHLSRATTYAHQAAAKDGRWSTLAADMDAYSTSWNTLRGGATVSTRVDGGASLVETMKALQVDCNAAGVNVRGG